MASHETESDVTPESNDSTRQESLDGLELSTNDESSKLTPDTHHPGGDLTEGISPIGYPSETLPEISAEEDGTGRFGERTQEAMDTEHRKVDSGVSDEPATSHSGARERPLPQDDFLIYDRLTRESTLAQDTLGFDYVRDDGIVVDGDSYIGLVQVQPRNWLVLNDAERMAVFRAYTSFLLGLKYPIQILSVPHEFDIGTHTEKIRIADSLARRKTESPILRHGRLRQVAWMHNTIDRLSVKDRDFYVLTRVQAGHVNAAVGAERPYLSLPILGDILGGILRSVPPLRSRRQRDLASRSEERCIKEVRARQNELSETLTKTGVSTRILSDRDEVMDILYQHYNHVESPFSTYNHATYTKLLSNALHREREA